MFLNDEQIERIIRLPPKTFFLSFIFPIRVPFFDVKGTFLFSPNELDRHY